MVLRRATIDDIPAIQLIEEEYYEGFSLPEKTLAPWIKTLPSNFIVADDEGNVAGFIFFEYLDKIQALPFMHNISETHRSDGKYAYISEIGVLDKYSTELMQRLFEQMLKAVQKDKIKQIIWITGGKRKHDKLETKIVKENGFIRRDRIKRWEYLPGKFTDSHWVWVKKL